MKIFDIGKTQQAIGLDISADNVKLVELKKQGEQTVLTSMGMVRISPEPIEEENINVRNELTVKAIKNLFSTLRLKPKNVVTTVAGSGVVVRYIKLPYMSAEELKNSIKYEAEEHIPFDIEHVVLDYQVLREFTERDERMQEIIIVAAKDDMINNFLNMLNKCKIDPKIISVDTFAIEEAWDYCGGAEGEEVVSLVDIGARITNVHIIDNRISCFNRDITIGGNDITEAIRRELNVSYQDAEALKEEQGGIILGDGKLRAIDERTSRISNAIEEVATKILEELDRSFAYYYTQLPVYRKNINKIYLTGGSARLGNLTTILSNGLGIPVEIFNPFTAITLSSKYDPGYVKKFGPMFAVAIGLALRGLS